MAQSTFLALAHPSIPAADVYQRATTVFAYITRALRKMRKHESFWLFAPQLKEICGGESEVLLPTLCDEGIWKGGNGVEEYRVMVVLVVIKAHADEIRD
jgi:hypothetical protein